jgi:FkbM family methyltransferase
MKFLNHLFNKNHEEFFRKSYSQEGEDLLLDRFFENQTTGFYADIGAFDPIKYSNTNLFYKKGWKGINIDATPGSMEKFKLIRPRDINLEIAISDREEYLTIYLFNEPALNTLSKEIASERQGLRNYKIVDHKNIPTRQIKDIFDEHLPFSTKIDFMNIDVEGYDLKVLKSNNWLKYRPKFVLIEEINNSFYSDWVQSDIYKYLHTIGYDLIAKTYYTYFYLNQGLT